MKNTNAQKKEHSIFCGFEIGDRVSLRGETGEPPEKHLSNLSIHRIYNVVNDVAPHVRISAYNDDGVCMADACVDAFIFDGTLVQPAWSEQMALAYSAGLSRKSVCPNDFEACYLEGLAHSF